MALIYIEFRWEKRGLFRRQKEGIVASDCNIGLTVIIYVNANVNFYISRLIKH